MIEFKTGDIFESDAEALVNAVNCVGVMGRGIALQFKNKYPENFKGISKRVNKKSYNRGKCLFLKQDNWYCQDGLSIFLPSVIGGGKAVLKISKAG